MDDETKSRLRHAVTKSAILGQIREKVAAHLGAKKDYQN